LKKNLYADLVGPLKKMLAVNFSQNFTTVRLFGWQESLGGGGWIFFRNSGCFKKKEKALQEKGDLCKMQQYRHLRSELETYGCDLSTMPTELGTGDEVQYAVDYLRQRVRSLAADALQRRDPDMHQHWIDVLARRNFKPIKT
jgi:hypothetical protein